MTKKTIFAMMAVALTFATVKAEGSGVGPAPCDTVPQHQSVGLVLSGGGAKGIAHIGVIQALEENDIPIDYITGTSMGAIVGGLYAAGYTPQEMLDLILSRGFSYWSTGRIDPDLVYNFTAEQPSPAMLTVPIMNKADSLANDTTAVPASLISPLPMSFAFMELFARYNAQCGSDFNNLFVPFRCCASDVAAHRRVVLGKGNFGDAVRSSMSFPIVFQPCDFEGMLLYDGGIYDNFPADVMKNDFAPDFTIGVIVASEAKGPQTSLLDQVENLVMQKSDYSLDPETGIRMRFDLNRFGLLDFQKARQIYKIGYDYTMSMMDSIKSRVHSRTPAEYRNLRRSVFKAKTPQLTFNSVNVTGAPEPQTRFLANMFRSPADTFSIDHARDAYYRAISTGKLRDLQPHAVYNDSTGLFGLNLKASVKNDTKVGIGGYVSSSASSYVYLSAGYSTLSFNSVSAKVSGWLGQCYMAAMLDARLNLPTSFPSAIDLEGVASRTNYYHSDKLFFHTDEPSFVHAYEYFGRLKWGTAAGRTAKVEAGAGFGHLYYSFYQPVDYGLYTPYRDRCRFNLGQVYALYEKNTLNDINYPTSGAFLSVKAAGLLGTFSHRKGDAGEALPGVHPKWVQLECRTSNYLNLSNKFVLGAETDVMLSTRKLLDDYNISIVAAPEYAPTPSSHNTFDPAFRANSFIAAGLTPIYRYSDNLSARLSLNGFLPLRKIIDDSGRAAYSNHWLSDPEFFGELALCYKLPFATVAAWGNYSTSDTRDWNVGISFGVFLHAPRFLR